MPPSGADDRVQGPKRFPVVNAGAIRQAFESATYPYAYRIGRKTCEEEKARLQAELVTVQKWAQETVPCVGGIPPMTRWRFHIPALEHYLILRCSNANAERKMPMGRDMTCRFGLTQPLATGRNWREELARHLTRLDLQSRISRFFTPLRDSAISAYVNRAAPLFLVTAEAEGRVVGVAEAHPHHDRRGAAEIAVSVDEELRRHGIGWELFSRAVAECRRRGIDDIWVVYIRGNDAMRRIADRAGFARPPDGDPTTVTAHLIDLAPAAARP